MSAVQCALVCDASQSTARVKDMRIVISQLHLHLWLQKLCGKTGGLREGDSEKYRFVRRAAAIKYDSRRLI